MSFHNSSGKKRKVSLNIIDSTVLNQHYSNIMPIGKGTYAEVKQGVNKITKQIEAIKVIPLPILDQQKVISEVNKLETLNSDHIVKFLRCIDSKEDQEIYVVMEMCQGNLRNCMEEKGNFTYQEIINFIVQIVTGFLVLEANSVMHLDLKPENILFKTQNYFKICDFGCSEVSQMSKISKMPSDVFGTFNYLAPENYLVRKLGTRRSSCDIWSFGVILYEMLHKRLPFDRETQGQKKGFLKRDQVRKYVEGAYQIDYHEDLKQEHIPKLTVLLKKMLNPDPILRPNWREVKCIVMQLFKRESFEFADFSPFLSKHRKMSLILFHFIGQLRYNLKLNIHSFWKITELYMHYLIHVAFLHCQKFNQLFQYRIDAVLSEKDKATAKLFLKKSAEEEIILSEDTLQIKVSEVRDLTFYEISLIDEAVRLQKVLRKQYQPKDLWDSMKCLLIFCQELRKAKESKELIGQVDKFPQTIRILGIK